jgi:hypothetical protein
MSYPILINIRQSSRSPFDDGASLHDALRRSVGMERFAHRPVQDCRQRPTTPSAIARLTARCARLPLVAMEPTATSSFAERLRRFARWFFTFSPEAAVDPAPKPRQQPVWARRQDAPQLRAHAQHAGRVGVSERKRP